MGRNEIIVLFSFLMYFLFEFYLKQMNACVLVSPFEIYMEQFHSTCSGHRRVNIGILFTNIWVKVLKILNVFFGTILIHRK